MLMWLRIAILDSGFLVDACVSIPRSVIPLRSYLGFLLRIFAYFCGAVCRSAFHGPDAFNQDIIRTETIREK